MPANYLETLNPFNLTAPPAAWLAELQAFDPDLVIFPSAMEPVYRVTKRAGDRPGIQTVRQRKSNDGTETAANLDTQTCWAHRLVPVSSIHPHAHWSPVLLHDLAERDLKRFGGHEKVSRMLEENEEWAQRTLDRVEGEDLAHQAGFAYRTIKWATGETMDPSARQRSTPPTASGYRRVMETRGNHHVMFSADEDRLLLKTPTPTPRDRGLVEPTDG